MYGSGTPSKRRHVRKKSAACDPVPRPARSLAPLHETQRETERETKRGTQISKATQIPLSSQPSPVVIPAPRFFFFTSQSQHIKKNLFSAK